MKIALITAGAAGMYCGNCLRDNTLATALLEGGEEVVLVPTYTPTRTDETNVSLDRVFYGGINVYLEQKSRLFRDGLLPGRFLDSPWLLRAVSRWAAGTDASKLGEMTISVLKGDLGNQRRELEKLSAWLAEDFRPDVINLPNVMFAGAASNLKRRLGVPVLCTLAGEDIFLEQLPEPHRREAIDLVREKAGDVDGFIATSHYYADFVANFLGISRDRIEVVFPGLALRDFEDCEPSAESGVGEGSEHCPTIGYLGRICPEKGVQVLLKAFAILMSGRDRVKCRLRIAGYLGPRDKPFLESLLRAARADGLGDHLDHAGELDRNGKVAFLKSLDVFSLPTVYREPKGLPVLESLAAGVPVVQPDHGSFPELISATGGGLLVEPDNPQALAEGIRRLLDDREARREFGERGQRAVREQFSAQVMATRVLDIYKRHVDAQDRPQH